MKKTFIISDTHFWHANLIQYVARPFKDVEEMNAHMIAQWNSVVGPEDTVYHLGDFAFSNKAKTRRVVDQLHGRRIILVMGNHDMCRTKTWWLDCGFSEVHREPIWYTEPGYAEERTLLCHDPLAGLYVQSSATVIHGHIHEKMVQGYTDNPRFKCVCVEKTNYTPLRIHVSQAGELDVVAAGM